MPTSAMPPRTTPTGRRRFVRLTAATIASLGLTTGCRWPRGLGQKHQTPPGFPKLPVPGKRVGAPIGRVSEDQHGEPKSLEVRRQGTVLLTSQAQWDEWLGNVTEGQLEGLRKQAGTVDCCWPPFTVDAFAVPLSDVGTPTAAAIVVDEPIVLD